jgi:hypothetical protein
MNNINIIKNEQVVTYAKCKIISKINIFASVGLDQKIYIPSPYLGFRINIERYSI